MRVVSQIAHTFTCLVNVNDVQFNLSCVSHAWFVRFIHILNVAGEIENENMRLLCNRMHAKDSLNGFSGAL